MTKNKICRVVSQFYVCLLDGESRPFCCELVMCIGDSLLAHLTRRLASAFRYTTFLNAASHIRCHLDLPANLRHSTDLPWPAFTSEVLVEGEVPHMVESLSEMT